MIDLDISKAVTIILTLAICVLAAVARNHNNHEDA